MNKTKSTRKFFDLPLPRTAADATRLDAFVENPRKFVTETFTPVELKRTVDFRSAGDVYPLREPNPDRFGKSARVLELAEDSYFVVDPKRANVEIAERTLPVREKTPPPTAIDQDSSIVIGLRASEYAYVQDQVEKNCHSVYTWDGESLMPPDQRRLQNKIECEIERRRKRDKNHRDKIVRSTAILKKTHPRGVWNVDTPLMENSKLYVAESQKLQKSTRKALDRRAQRTALLAEKASCNSGLLYHEPARFQHKLTVRPDFAQKVRSTGCPDAREDTFKRVFEKAAIGPFHKGTTEHYINLKHTSGEQ